MKYTFSTQGDITILKADTLLLAYENIALLKEIEEKISEGCVYFIIDLSEMKYMNSIGLSFMIAVLTKSRNAGGETVIVNVLDKIDQLLAVTKLKSIFTVCKNETEAVQELSLLINQPVLF